MIPRDSTYLFLFTLLTFRVFAQSTISAPSIIAITAVPSWTQATPSQQTPSAISRPTSFSSPTPSSHTWDGILSSADFILDELNEHLHIDLRKRQGGIAATNAPAAATTVATQMSPITTYGPDRGWPAVVYSQAFVAVPDQWPSPVAGTIGLGTIQGEVGVVKSNSKRGNTPEPTGQVVRIKGREVVIG